MEFYAKLKKLFILTGEIILSEEPDAEKILERDRITRSLFTMNLPNSYRTGDPDNCIVLLEQTFGALSAMLESNGTNVNEQTTCFSFYAKIEYLNKQYSKKK